MKTNNEVEERAKKYELLRRRCKALEAKVRRMKKVTKKTGGKMSATKSHPQLFSCQHCEYRSLHPHHILRHMRQKHEEHPVFEWSDLCDLATRNNQSIKKLNSTISFIANVLGRKYFVQDVRGVSLNNEICKVPHHNLPSRNCVSVTLAIESISSLSCVVLSKRNLTRWWRRS